MNGAVDLLEYNTEEENDAEDSNLEFLTIDFSDAFYTLWLEAQAKGIAFKTMEGWAVFLRLCLAWRDPLWFGAELRHWRCDCRSPCSSRAK